MSRRWLFALAAAGATVWPFAWTKLRLASDLGAARQSLFTAEPQRLVDELCRCRKLYPKNAEVHYLLAVANRRAAHTESARKDLAEAQRLGWSREDVRRQERMIRFQSGEMDDEPWLLGLLEAGGTDAQALELYECCVKGYLSAMRVRDAEFWLSNWIRWQPRAIEPRLLRAELMHVADDRSAEAREYNLILQIEPDNHNALRSLGTLLLEANDVDGALARFQRYHSLAPNESRPLVSIATCYQRLGRLPEAKEAVNEALRGELNPAGRSLALTKLAQLALSEKKNREAIAAAQEAIRLAPSDADAHYALGSALSRAGEAEQAKRHFEESRAIQKRASRYVELVHQIMTDPIDPTRRCEAGEINLEQGQPKKAFAWFQSALRCDRAHAPTHRALARYYAKSARKDLADRHLALAAEQSGEMAGAQ